ncbi:Sec-independent protein translocase protein TatB [Phyllobacteriaceae bacterium JZ32]
MLDIGWSEILVIAIVLIVVVGPKDLPRMLRAFGQATSRMRKTANEFRRQFDEALREAELEDVKNVVEDARRLDPRSDIRKVFDPLRSAGEELRSSLNQAAVAPAATPVPPPPPEPVPSADAPVEAAPQAVAATKAGAAVADKPAGKAPAPVKASGTSAKAAARKPAAKPRARTKAKADDTGSKA